MEIPLSAPPQHTAKPVVGGTTSTSALHTAKSVVAMVTTAVHHEPKCSPASIKAPAKKEGNGKTLKKPTKPGLSKKAAPPKEKTDAEVLSRLSKLESMFEKVMEILPSQPTRIQQQQLRAGHVGTACTAENHGGVPFGGMDVCATDDSTQARGTLHDDHGGSSYSGDECDFPAAAAGYAPAELTGRPVQVPSFAAKFAVSACVGDPINDELANSTNYLISHCLEEKSMEESAANYPAPSNCPNLLVPKVNPVIWDNVTQTTRSRDVKLQRIYSSAVPPIQAHGQRWIQPEAISERRLARSWRYIQAFFRPAAAGIQTFSPAHADSPTSSSCAQPGAELLDSNPSQAKHCVTEKVTALPKEVLKLPFENSGMSSRTVDILAASWRASTQRQYCTYIRKWRKFCTLKKESHLHAKINFVLEFFTHMFYEENLSYSAINSARSALATFLVLEDEQFTVSTHPLLSRFMRGVFQLRPPRPRYSEIWDVNIVFRYLRSLAPANSLSLKQLTMKLCMLLALISTQRVQTLHCLNLDSMILKQSMVSFKVNEHLKQSRPGNFGLDILLKAYPPDRRLCVVTYIKAYLRRTKEIRGEESHLFISFRKPFKRVTAQTISRWIKEIMTGAGIDTTMFSAHSTRAASSSAANRADAPIPLILAKAGWSKERTFRKFYDKPLQEEGQCLSQLIVRE
ncbi:uncharacterized protein [Diadema antillarum]|uniref:uncharacterized protein n=1 Tax=Diadema antillarum TaxID=105358 RepID=UPI003A8B6891